MNTVAPEKVGCSSARLERIGTRMQQYVEQAKIAGVLAMVTRAVGRWPMPSALV